MRGVIKYSKTATRRLQVFVLMTYFVCADACSIRLLVVSIHSFLKGLLHKHLIATTTSMMSRYDPRGELSWWSVREVQKSDQKGAVGVEEMRRENGRGRRLKVAARLEVIVSRHILSG